MVLPLRNSNKGNKIMTKTSAKSAVSFEITEDKNALVPTFKLRARQEGRQGQPRVVAIGPSKEAVSDFQKEFLASLKTEKKSKAIVFEKTDDGEMVIAKVSLFPKSDNRGRGGGRKKEFDRMVGAFGVTLPLLARLKTKAHTDADDNISEVIRAALDAYLPSIDEANEMLDKLIAEDEATEAAKNATPATDETSTEGDSTGDVSDETVENKTETPTEG